MRAPESCNSLAELREEIDRHDRDIVAMLARRAAFIDRAAELKPRLGLPARIGERVEAVVANVREASRNSGLDPDLTERVWRMLIEWSIAREEKVLGPSAPATEKKQ